MASTPRATSDQLQGGGADGLVMGGVRKALVTIQHTATEVANAPTVGLYYVREHVRSSLPLVVASRQEVTAAQEELQDALYASRGAEEFAVTLGAVLPGVLARLGDGLARACASAAAATAATRPETDSAPGMLSSTLDLLKLRGTGTANSGLVRSAGGGAAGATGGS